MKITISGDIGSGKSTVAKIVAKRLNLSYYSTGQIFRKMAYDMGLSLLELSELAEKDKRIDKRIDNYQKRLGEKEDNFVFEGRLGWYFIPDSVKVYLKVDVEEAARRIMNDNRSDEKFSSLEEAIKSIKERREFERRRYKSHYGIDIEDPSNYDLIIDTTKIPPDKVADKIVDYLNSL